MDEQTARERTWAALEGAEVDRFPGARGRIPNFTGAEAAAERLGALAEWKAARAIKANPDLPQLPVRARALAEGKTVYMAVPRLASAIPALAARRCTPPPASSPDLSRGMSDSGMHARKVR